MPEPTSPPPSPPAAARSMRGWILAIGLYIGAVLGVGASLVLQVTGAVGAEQLDPWDWLAGFRREPLLIAGCAAVGAGLGLAFAAWRLRVAARRSRR